MCQLAETIGSALHMRLTTAPITVGDYAWVCAAAFVGPGVTVGEGVVLGARSPVFRDAPAWCVLGGIPARVLKNRVVRDAPEVFSPEGQSND